MTNNYEKPDHLQKASGEILAGITLFTDPDAVRNIKSGILGAMDQSLVVGKVNPVLAQFRRDILAAEDDDGKDLEKVAQAHKAATGTLIEILTGVVPPEGVPYLATNLVALEAAMTIHERAAKGAQGVRSLG